SNSYAYHEQHTLCVHIQKKKKKRKTNIHLHGIKENNIHTRTCIKVNSHWHPKFQA
ncbi:unnamed protein product, partial [Musa textilis]